jgi:hypothetical protein
MGETRYVLQVIFYLENFVFWLPSTFCSQTFTPTKHPLLACAVVRKYSMRSLEGSSLLSFLNTALHLELISLPSNSFHSRRSSCKAEKDKYVHPFTLFTVHVRRKIPRRSQHTPNRKKKHGLPHAILRKSQPCFLSSHECPFERDLRAAQALPGVHSRCAVSPLGNLAQPELDVLADQNVCEIGALDAFDPCHLRILQLQGTNEKREEKTNKKGSQKKAIGMTHPGNDIQEY